MGAADLRKWIPEMGIRSARAGELSELAQGHRVVVVMTTIPPRIQRIEPVLDAMLAQSWPIAALYLSVPYRYNRTGEAYIIPDWLRGKAGVTVVRCEDLGPGTHLLNGLRLERDPWSFLVVVDDDHIYSPDLVENLMRATLAQPGSAVAAQGFLSIPGLEVHRDSPRYLHDQGFAAGPVLVSYLGVVYQRGFFDESVFDYSNASPQCRYQDDMWFSAHLAKKGIPRKVLGAALGVQELRDMHLGPESLTFWKENKPRAVSNECNTALLRESPGLWAWRRRVVLALGGLPPTSATLGAGDREWAHTLATLRLLPRQPDLIYLCTESGDLQLAGATPRSEKPRLGESFWLGGVLVTRAAGCPPHPEQPRVTQLLKAPLEWEGDDRTVLVLGALGDVAERAGDVATLARCAASRSEGGGEGGVAQSPFCRMGDLAAVTLGALHAAL